MLQKSLDYAIDKFGRFYKVPEKIVIFKKLKNYKIWAMNLSSNCFIKNFFWSKTLFIVAQMAKETGFLPYSLVKYGQGLKKKEHYHLW